MTTRFTRFTITQDGQHVGSAAVKEQTINAAKGHAVRTGRSVSVVGHIDGGGTREVIFHPDGSANRIWAIDQGRPFAPTAGQVYVNQGGGRYHCLAVEADDGPSPGRIAAVFQNIASGWTFTAKGIIQYVDGTIEWDHSLDGRFEDIVEGGAT